MSSPSSAALRNLTLRSLSFLLTLFACALLSLPSDKLLSVRHEAELDVAVNLLEVIEVEPSKFVVNGILRFIVVEFLRWVQVVFVAVSPSTVSPWPWR